MKPTRQQNGSTIAAVITVVVILGLVIFAGMQLSQVRHRLTGQIDGLEAELATARARIDEMQTGLEAEQAARKQAEETAQEAGDAAMQARQEMEGQQETLGQRIQELETSMQEREQQLAAAEAAKTQAETQVASAAGQRQEMEREIADVKAQLEQQLALVSELQASASATTAAKQSFAGESPADTGAAFDTPPKPLDLVSPEYPRSLGQEGTAGHVVVVFTVDTRGRVQDVEAREATNDEFAAAALAAVRQWRFKPALREGEPVEVRISQRLDFTGN